MVKKEYNTKARKYVLKFLTDNAGTTVSVADIVTFLKEEGISVNFTTVYRCLNKLVSEQKAIKFTQKDGQKAVFQLANHENSCDEHLHIQCVKCGKLMHLDCDFMNEMSEHILKEHGFSIQCEGSILYGTCDECKK